jgi:hypothetical protein
MSTLDDISKSLRDLYQRISVTGRRTATVTRLRMELAGLDRKRRDTYALIGERLDELKRTGRIHDAGLLGLMESEFESLDRLRKRIQETMDSIQELNLQETQADEYEEDMESKEVISETENLLDSFDVL